MNKFSIVNRKQEIEHAKNQKFDLIVIGGGVTGAGIALDACSRGMKVLLVEKFDYASGTSSKSTKLIHGGLRYLKQLELGLVKESGTERSIVHALAPHLVHPEKMFLPIVKNGSFTKWSASLAISVYDWLAKVKSKDRKITLNREEAHIQEPLVKSKLLKAGILYSEYRTDDARLTIELIKKAQQLGVTIFNYCKVERLLYSDGKLIGVNCTDSILQNKYAFNARFVVSAAGPWVDTIRAKDNSLNHKRLRLTKGVHLVFTHERLPVSESVYFDDFKGRMLFAIPRNGVTYVGTTDTDFDGDKDNITCNENDVKYILNATNAIFDIQPLTKEDVISSWAGLRPLIGEQGKPASEVSRKDEIFESASGLISIAGGKLTGYRKMAERLVDFIVGKADEGKYSACQTEFLKLTENAFADYDAVNDFILQLFERYGQLGLTKQECTNLVWTYGKASAQILEKVQNLKDSKSAFSNNLLKVEIEYCISFESVWRPSDYFIRRTGMLYFNPQKLIDNFELIINTFQEHFEWDALTLQSVIAESKKQINNSLLKPVL